MDLPVPGCALAVGAHPDDVEFGAGATLAKWARAGCTIHHLVLTDGSKGSWDPSADLGALVAARQREQLEAARRLGSQGQVVMLAHVDGELGGGLASGPQLRDEVARWIRRLRPDVVLGHDPWKRYRLHPDHRHAGWATVDGVVVARDPHFLPHEPLEAHRPSALLLFEADEPDHLEDVTGLGDVKVDALLAHESQLRSTMGIEPGDDGSQRAAFRRLVLDRLADAGRPAGLAHAEAFKAILEL